MPAKGVCLRASGPIYLYNGQATLAASHVDVWQRDAQGLGWADQNGDAVHDPREPAQAWHGEGRADISTPAW